VEQSETELSATVVTMKALQFEKYGTPSVLSVRDLAVPVPAAGEVLVEVHASAINPSDVKNVAGVFGASLPRVPGRDYAGLVVAGDGTWKGKEVWGSGVAAGVGRDGTHAQYVLLSADALAEKPAHLSMEQAATVGVPYIAAWSALIQAANVVAGETILVTGVLGAVGRAATQIAHWRKAKVIGADIADKASEADLFINTKEKDLPVSVRALTNGIGVDFALDLVGGPMFEPCLKSLRIGGRQVALTSVGNRRVEFDLTDFYHNRHRLIGVDTMKLSGPEIATIMSDLRVGFDEGHFTVPTPRAWPLGRAIEAYTVVAAGDSTKHVVVPQRP
jgi:NADPH2:quinone reductase